MKTSSLKPDIIMKKVIFIVSAILLTVQSSGQKDQNAEPYLDKISKDLESENAVFINFNYEREDQQTGSSTKGEGNLLLFEEKYRIDLGNVIIFYDGVKQYSLQTEIEEVYISKPDPESEKFMFADPIKLLRDYKQAFKYRLMGLTEIYGISMYEIQLYPEELDGPYALLKLFFDVRDDALKSIVVRHKQGVLYTMMITELSKKDKPGNDYFKFNQEDFPNVEVIELLN